MKYLLLLIFSLNIGGLAAFAQTPPPPPLIYKAPDKSELKEFIAKDKSFQITFPGTPKVTEKVINGGNITDYRVYRQGSNSVVTVSKADFNIENRKEILYELMKGALISAPKSKIVAEKDVRINGISGKEFDILKDYHYQKTRILIFGKWIYEISSDVTNWHIIGEKTKDEFFNETERFFNSLKILK